MSLSKGNIAMFMLPPLEGSSAREFKKNDQVDENRIAEKLFQQIIKDGEITAECMLQIGDASDLISIQVLDF